MSLRTQSNARSFASLFLAVLAIQMSLVIPHTEWMCRCGDEVPHTAACCCNCPKCVENRNGLLSYCSLSGAESKANRQGQFLENSKCPCGLGRMALNLPGDSPYLPLGEAAAIFMMHRPADPSPPGDSLADATVSIIQPPG
jgi:hypothetical protein